MLEFKIDGPLTRGVRADLADQVAARAHDIELYENPGPQAIEYLASCMEALARAVAAEIRDGKPKPPAPDTAAELRHNNDRSRAGTEEADVQHDELQDRVQKLSAQVQDVRLEVKGSEWAPASSVEDLAAAVDGLVSLFWDQVTGSTARPAPDTDKNDQLPWAPDHGLNKLRLQAGPPGRAWHNISDEYLRSVEQSNRETVSVLDHDGTLSKATCRDQAATVAHLLGAIAEIKSTLNRLNWGPSNGRR